MAAITRFGSNGYWKDRKGYKMNGMSLTGVPTFEAVKTFLDAMKAFTNLALLRYSHTATTTERKAGESTSTGHFDLAGYVARLVFYNYAAEDAGDSPSMTFTIPAPKDAIIEETKDGIWVVKEDSGILVAGHIATALGLSAGDIEYIRGEVPEN